MKELKQIKIFVINLEKRKDRLEEVSQMLEDYQWERIEAIETTKGYYGCVLSHIKCLKKAKEEGLSEVVIMEDDFHFVGDGKFYFPPPECDVCLYSCKLNKKEDYNDNFYKVIDGRHTDFYLVKQHYYDRLISTFTESLMNLLNKYHHKNYLDVYWLENQKKDLFLCPHIRLGFQREGYSDIVYKEKNRETSLNQSVY